MDIGQLDAATREVLQRYGFDGTAFDALRARVARGELDARTNRLRGLVEPPAPEDVVALPRPGTPEHDALRAEGEAAIARGEVGCVVLAGGMATRFGGVVKAGVDALPGHTFFELKVRDVRGVAERSRAHPAARGATASGPAPRVPVYAMTSFATDAEVARLGAALTSEAAPVRTFVQSVMLRLTPGGEVFREDDGRASPYAPGHGDLVDALRRSGVLAEFRAAGGRTLVMSNVDNLGATLDAAIVGAHLRAREGARPSAITAEVTSKEPGEKGGAPARVDGKPQIVEAFRFPEGFDQDAIPVFNTNTLMIDAAAIDRDFDLTWFVVEKKVDGRPCLQLERLVGELTAFLPCAFVAVPRYGVDGRFQPAKDPEELARRRPDLEAILRARGVLG